jgi:hypothetical protein
MGFSVLAFFSALFFAGSVCGASGPSQGQARATHATSMPIGRATDSYSIYSRLIPLGETAGSDWPHTLWLVQDVTISAIPNEEPCSGSTRFAGSMNPHTAVHPDVDRKQDYDQIMADFDTHCHDRLRLEADQFAVTPRVHLLDEAEQKEFRSTRFGAHKADPAVAAKYKGAPALYAFSVVYFNAHHTVALVYATHWCGGLCGQGMWLAFEHEDGAWHPLRWAASSWIS